MALQTSRLNAFRLNHSRLNYLIVPKPRTSIALMVSGAWVNFDQYALVEGASITQALNEVPDTATIRFRGNVGQPLKGQEISFWQTSPYASLFDFAGHILAVRTVYEGIARNVAYECDCIDYTWALNFRKVTKRYTGATVTTIVADLVSSFGPPGFYVSINPAVPATPIDEITFTNEEIAQAISRTCERLGLYWLVDYFKTVRVFTSAALASAGTITQTNARTSSKLAKHEDLSPVATVIHGRGGGSSAGTDAIPGQTSLPVLDPAWYAAGGGTVESGPQRFTYASVQGMSGAGSTTGLVQIPGGMGSGASGQFEIVLANSTGTHLAPGRYYVGITNYTAQGETLPWQFTVDIPAGYNEIWIYPRVRPTDPKILGFCFFATNAPNQSYAQMGNPYANTPGSAYGPFNDGSTYDGTISQNRWVTVTSGPRYRTPPTINSAGETSTSTPAGSTSILVEDLAPFTAAGGWLITPGGQIVRYTGKSASSGAGSLTGIPASGVGSITAPIRSGTVKLAPYLDGIPASGADAIKYAIKTGDEVYVFVEVSDTVAITNLKAWIGYGDGKRYEFLTDGRLSLGEVTTRAQALLAYRKDPLVTLTFETRDPVVTVGKTITINTTSPPIAGTFLIQRVQISDMPAAAHIKPVPPRRVVEASSRRFTFDDLVQQIKLLGRIN